MTVKLQKSENTQHAREYTALGKCNLKNHFTPRYMIATLNIKSTDEPIYSKAGEERGDANLVMQTRVYGVYSVTISHAG